MSTSHAQLDLIEETSITLDRQKYTLFIDLEKAVDIVNYSILTEKLSSMV